MKKKEAIDEILDNFNFERAHNVMVHLDWEWSSVAGVPDIADLRKCARRLLKDVAYSKEYHSIGTGGLEASKKDGELSLKFVLEYWGEEFTK